MTDTTERHMTEAVARFVHFWNTAPDEQRRSGADTFVDDVAYIAPVGVLRGVGALADFTEQFAQNVGDYEFRMRAEPDIHNDRARVRWEIQAGGTSFAEGTDVLSVGEAGHIDSVVTFIDRAPAAPPHHDGAQDL